MISEGQRLQYLEAMGIQAWISRERASDINMPVVDSVVQPQSVNRPAVSKPSNQQAVAHASVLLHSFVIGPGSGSTLLLCNRPEDAALPLANDIARCLVEAPVWGWLRQEIGGPGKKETGLSLERAIDERLFTRVLLFCGDATASQAGKVEVFSSARIIYAPPLAELARDPEQKRSLWMQLLTHGWCSRRG